MPQKPRHLAIAFAGVVAALPLFTLLSQVGVFDYDVWTRENPLVSPVAVTSVQDGTINLADGRALRPAGVRRQERVSAADYDNALRVIAAQGVVVVRDLGDGSAFLLAEPKFYNWCGTRNMDGIPWKSWAGSYLQCPVSELLIHTAYATPALDQAGFTARERWRLEGVGHVAIIAESPTRIADKLSAFRYDGSERSFSVYDAALETMWKPPPAP